MIRVVHPGSRMLTFSHPGSRGQKGTQSRIRIRNTAGSCDFFGPWIRDKFLRIRIQPIFLKA